MAKAQARRAGTTAPNVGVALEQLEQVRADLARLALPDQSKLSAEAFLAEACRIARKTPAEIRTLAEQLAADQGRTWPGAWAAVTRTTRQLRTVHWPAPTPDGRRLAYLVEGALAEGFSAFEIQAVAAVLVAASHPDVFGVVDDWEERTRQFRALEERERELKAALREEREKLRAEASALTAAAASLGVD